MYISFLARPPSDQRLRSISAESRVLVTSLVPSNVQAKLEMKRCKEGGREQWVCDTPGGEGGGRIIPLISLPFRFRGAVEGESGRGNGDGYD